MIKFSTNPVVVAAVITAIVSLAASYVSLVSSREQRELDWKKWNDQFQLDTRKATDQLQYEFVKSEFDFVLQAVRAASPNEAAENLTFLLATGIIQRPELQAKLSKYLQERKTDRSHPFQAMQNKLGS